MGLDGDETMRDYVVYRKTRGRTSSGGVVIRAKSPNQAKSALLKTNRKEFPKSRRIQSRTLHTIRLGKRR